MTREAWSLMILLIWGPPKWDVCVRERGRDRRLVIDVWDVIERERERVQCSAMTISSQVVKLLADNNYIWLLKFLTTLTALSQLYFCFLDNTSASYFTPGVGLNLSPHVWTEIKKNVSFVDKNFCYQISPWQMISIQCWKHFKNIT